VDKSLSCSCNRFPGCILFLFTQKTQILFCYVFFCRYVAVYFSILYFRYRAGIVTKEMLSVPKLPFLIVGVLESLALAAGMAAACRFTLKASFPSHFLL
jgi:hypothetical protein